MGQLVPSMGRQSDVRIFYAAGSRPNNACGLTPYHRHTDLRRSVDVAFVARHQSLLETALLQQVSRAHGHQPLDLPHDCDITFVGAAYGDRPGYLRALLDAGLDAHAWGPGWSELALLPAAIARSRRALGQVNRRLLGTPLHPPVLRRPPRLPRSACGGLLSEIGGAEAVTLGIAIVGWQLGEPTGLVGWFEARRASIARLTSGSPVARAGCRPASASEMSTELAAEHVRDAALGRS